MDRNTLMENYVARIVDGMDTNTLYNFVYNTLLDRLDDYTDADLMNEIAAQAPDLLDEDFPEHEGLDPQEY